MARTAGSSGAKTLKAIRKVAIRQIYDRGYEAMNLRQLAADVGIQAGSLYNHIKNKQDLLFDIMRTVMTDLHRDLNRELDGDGDCRRELRGFIDVHIRFNTRRRKEVFISNMELRSLDKGNHKSIVAMRAAYEDRLRGILARGREEAAWSIDDVDVTAYALIAMLSGVVNWYRASGRLSIDELIDTHIELILHGLDANGAVRAV